MKPLHHFRPLLSLAALALILSTTVLSANDFDDSAGKVKAGAKVAKVDKDGWSHVEITLDIEKEWHLYANPVRNETFEGGRTLMKFAPDLEVDQVTYPPGKLHVSAGFRLQIYEGKVVLKAKVRPKKKDTPIKVQVKVNACHDRIGCLQPGTLKLTAK